MKRFYLIILMILTIIVSSCGAANYVSRRTVSEMDEISYVLANYYPQLHNYYMEGVLDVDSMKEIVLEDGTVDYKIKYHFMRYYFRNYSDRIETLKIHFPELYEMYVSGVIEINSLYKYVEKSTGRIRYHCNYDRIYDYYYRYYPRYNGTHIYYYGPRVQPPPPRRPRVDPRPQPGNRPPEARPNDRPRDNGRQPNVNQNNPPRTGGGNVNRGSQPSRSTGGSGGSRSSGTNNSGRRGR